MARKIRPAIGPECKIRVVRVPGSPMVECRYTFSQGKSHSLSTASFTMPDGCEGAVVQPIIEFEAGLSVEAHQFALHLVQGLSRGARHVRQPEFVLIGGARDGEKETPKADHRTSFAEAAELWVTANPPEGWNVADAVRAICDLLDEVRGKGATTSRLECKLESIDSIHVRDFMPFLDSKVELGPGVYSIAAEYVGEYNRSNRAGKSALLDAVNMAVFGKTSRKDRSINEYIRWGTEEGHVGVRLTASGSKINVTRTFDKKHTTFQATMGKQVFDQVTRGRQAIVSAVGMDYEDFTRTSLVHQGEVLGILGETASPLKDHIGRWLGLDAWKPVNKRAEERLRALRTELSDHNALFASAQSTVERCPPSEPGRAEALTERINELNRKIGEIDSLDRATRTAFKAATESAEVEEEAQSRFEEARAQAKRTSRRGASKAAVKALEALREELEGLRREWQGEDVSLSWDNNLSEGVCPIDLQGCPRSREVLGNVECSRKKRRDREALEKELRAKIKTAEAKVKETSENEKKSDVDLALLEQEAKLATKRASEAAEEHAACKKRYSEARQNEDSLRSEVRELWNERDDLKKRANERERAEETARESEARIAELLPEIKRLEYITRATGRDGVPSLQMRAAVDSLQAFSDDVMARLSLGYRVRLAFDENEQLRPTIFEAGRTGSLAMDSGAGKTLAALAVRLALSSMVGTKVLFLDEICGMLDGSNLNALASMLRELPALGFNQVFVVSHRPEIAEGLDARILVTVYPGTNSIADRGARVSLG